MRAIESTDTIVLIEHQKNTSTFEVDGSTRMFEHSFQTGPAGTSAYQAALNDGFVGTRQEWLESIQGLSAYEVAINEGFVGTRAEWLESLKGVPVTPQDEGKLVTNDGADLYWETLNFKLNNDVISWDLGEFT